ncbi:hypothetical protein GOBAR_DD35619 [Gossypium barbadense]|nr:hypothetical protein GOBAR_DD35619 [Gossypium barbadense]
MAGMRLSPEESTEANQHLQLPQQQLQTGREAASDDDRSVAADSWSIKSDYGSTLDDEQRHADAAEALSSAANFRPASDYSSDKDEPDAETSMLGLQSYWDAAYLDELANFREHGHVFGTDVMDTVISWTKSLCTDVSQGHIPNHVGEPKPQSVEHDEKYLSCWSVLDIGTGNGLLLQELSKQGFTDLTGTDYSEGAIDLARSLADRDGFSNIKFLVITSCNHTKDELVQEVENFNQRNIAISQEPSATKDQETHRDHPPFRYLNHVRTYPTFMFGGSVGSRVATVAFLRN